MYVKRTQNYLNMSMTSPYSFKRIRIQIRKQDSFDWYRVMSGLSINVDNQTGQNWGVGSRETELGGAFRT